MRYAASSEFAFISFIFTFTMSMTSFLVNFPTFALFGSFEPAAIFAAFFKRMAAGGALVMNVKDLSL